MIIIRNWNDIFENAQSRRFERTHWVAMPNKRGFGYTKILKEKNGEAMFGCWCAIVELASTCKPRGELQSNGIPYSYSDVSALTLYSEKTVSETITFCCNSLGWIVDTVSNTEVIPNSHSSKPTPPVSTSIQFSSILSKDIKEEDLLSPKNVFMFWLLHPDLTTHRKLTKDQQAAIRQWRDDYSEQELCNAVRNYADALDDKNNFYTYKHTIEDFFRKGTLSKPSPFKRFVHAETAPPKKGGYIP